MSARHAALALVTILACATSASAQSTDSLRVGTRVRVATSTLPEVVGTITDVRADTLLLRGDDGMLAVVRRDITHADISGGRPIETWKGERTGFIAGVIVGAVIGYERYSPSECIPETSVCRNEDMLKNGALYGAIGFVAGGLLAVSMPERWSPIVGAGTARVGTSRGTTSGMSFGLAVHL